MIRFLAALLFLSGAVSAQEPSAPGPWDPQTMAAAEAAVARLAERRALDIRAEVLRIVGLEPGVAGGGTGIVATVQEVEQAMRELGARETSSEVRVELPADVLFDFDRADIRPDAARALARLATLIRAYPEGTALFEGHTDSHGNDAYNQQLSERRAESVKLWLVEREGIDADQLSTRGLGEGRPIASNETDEGRQKNRRVEVVIRKGS